MSEEEVQAQGEGAESAETAEDQTTAPKADQTEAPAEEQSNSVKLDGLYAFKVGMSSVFDENGASVPVTVLQYKPWVVSQVKTKDKDGYEAVQLACDPKKPARTSAAQKGHLKNTSFEHGAKFIREMRQALPEGIVVGQKVEIGSLAKGDTVKMTAKSKGRGFSSVIKRWDFGGGRASHGGKATHRAPGSIGNCTFPGRVMKGRKMGGQFGNETTTVKNVKIVDVIPDENVVLVKGPVPGSRNSLVRLMKA
jgi:large subunit ribosomal protein L3